MNWIMEPFNGLFFAAFGAAIGLIVLFSLIFKGKSEKSKKIFITAFCAVLIAVYFVYKYFLSIDKQFLTVSNPPIEKFNWFNELPLHLCNINMFLIPIGVLADKRGIMGFSFFLAPLGAAMAIISPDVAFTGYPIYMPRMLGYYITHILIIVAGMLLLTMGFYKPKFRDLSTILLTFTYVSFAIHCVNIVFRATGICKVSNYFYTMEDAGIGILHSFYTLLPFRFFYLLPAVLILVVYMLTVMLTVMLVDKIKAKKTDSQKEPVGVK